MKNIVIIIVLLLLISCVERKPFEGYIVGKDFRKRHTTYILIDEQLHLMTHPNKWYIYVADSTKVIKKEVSEKRFNELKKGDFIILP